MICGHCKQHHLSVMEVRACYEERDQTTHEPSDSAGSSDFPTLADPQPVPEDTAHAEVRRAERPERTKPVSEGFYSMLGRIYKVQRAVHGSGKLYAKELVVDPSTGKGSWFFEPGRMRLLQESMKLTEAEAVAFGQLYGICAVCGATLTDERSIARGIGPVCANKMGW